MYLQAKNTLKNNIYHTLKQAHTHPLIIVRESRRKWNSVGDLKHNMWIREIYNYIVTMITCESNSIGIGGVIS